MEGVGAVLLALGGCLALVTLVTGIAVVAIVSSGGRRSRPRRPVPPPVSPPAPVSPPVVGPAPARGAAPVSPPAPVPPGPAVPPVRAVGRATVAGSGPGPVPPAPRRPPSGLRQRLRATWFPLMFLPLLAWLDWIMYRNVLFILVVGGAVAAAILYHRELARRLGIAGISARLPPVGRALLFAAPPLLYFLFRGRGSSGAGALMVILVALGIVVLVARYGPLLDERLARFYEVRDRVLHLPVRAVIALLTPVIVGFGLVHGSLTDLPALLGGATQSPRLHTEAFLQLLLGTLVTAAVSLLLLRGRPVRRLP